MHKTTLLAILQQTEYDLPRFEKWVKQHRSDTTIIQPEAWTPKLKLISSLSSGLFFLSPVQALKVATHLTQPGEQIWRWMEYFLASYHLWQVKRRGLKVIAVAGSYGKTSTKHILAHTLGSAHQVLVTPKSINTLLGIAQIIRHELKPSHTLFVVELGEYRRHDIAKLIRFVQADYGVLTPIGAQHLEILGNVETIVAEFTDMLAYFAFDPRKVIVADINRSHFPQSELRYYGTDPACPYRVTSPHLSRAGTEYVAELPERENQPTSVSVFLPLFGEHQAVNSLPSFWLGDALNIDRTAIKKRLASTPYVPRRHEPTLAQNDVLILDNSFNTNQQSIVESLKLLNDLQPTRRLMVTLGFTELGNEAELVHYQLGQRLAKAVDYLCLLQAPWTEAIVRGFVEAGGQLSQIQTAKSQTEAIQLLEKYIIPGSVILLEGGFREVYV